MTELIVEVEKNKFVTFHIPDDKNIVVVSSPYRSLYARRYKRPPIRPILEEILG